MPPETLSTALVTPRIGSNLCELLMPPIIGVKSAGKRCEWEWEMLATLERANSVAHSSNWQKSVSHDTFILTDQLGCPSLQKGEGGEEGRLPTSLPLSLPSILEQRSPLSLHPLPSRRPKRCNLRRPPSRNRRSAWPLLCAPTCRGPPRYACESTGRRRCRHGGRGRRFRRGDGTERVDES